MASNRQDVPAGPKVLSPPPEFARRAHIQSFEQYKQMYDLSIADPDAFWAQAAEQFHWQAKWKRVREFDFKNEISIKYFIDGKTNITYNALDRHLQK